MPGLRAPDPVRGAWPVPVDARSPCRRGARTVGDPGGDGHIPADHLGDEVGGLGPGQPAHRSAPRRSAVTIPANSPVSVVVPSHGDPPHGDENGARSATVVTLARRSPRPIRGERRRGHVRAGGGPTSRGLSHGAYERPGRETPVPGRRSGAPRARGRRTPRVRVRCPSWRPVRCSPCASGRCGCRSLRSCRRGCGRGSRRRARRHRRWPCRPPG
jgi:hypothetical protein